MGFDPPIIMPEGNYLNLLLTNDLSPHGWMRYFKDSFSDSQIPSKFFLISGELLIILPKRGSEGIGTLSDLQALNLIVHTKENIVSPPPLAVLSLDNQL